MVLLPMRLGDLWIAVDARVVEEVVGRRTWIAVPGAPRFVPGVLPWRGRAIGVVDLGAALGLCAAADPRSSRPRLVVLRAREAMVAVPADGVREAANVENVRAPNAARPPHATGELELGGVTLAVVDVEAAVAQIVGEA
jgi:chemotaxis signal transduction protein